MPGPDALRFVVNRASGGRAGSRLIGELRALVDPARVLDLAGGDLADFVRRARDDGCRLIACGGDGTVAAVLEEAHAHGGPAVGIIPLGTGNDLARCFGWQRRQDLPARLADLAAAPAVALDRWLLHAPPPLGERAWFNYCSWGSDARVARRFHQLRARHPGWFRSPAANQAMYAGLGLVAAPVDLATALRWQGGGQLPASARSLVVLNIPSYAGGRQLGTGIAPDDGRCDVFALPAGLALGLRLAGWRRTHPLGAWPALDVDLERPLIMQLDGEPLAAPVGRYRVRPSGQVPVLAAPRR